MELVYLVALNVLGHLVFVAARMTTALFALHLGASELTVGIVMALFAALPMLLSVLSGRLIDRIGPRRPLLVAFAAMTLGSALPFAFPVLPALFVSSTLIGVGFMFVHIGMNSIFGAYGLPENRPMNFAWLALGFSVSSTAGPLVAGFAIEGLGHAAAYLLLDFFPALALAMLALRKRAMPRPERHPAGQEGKRRLADLWHVPGLRNVFGVSVMIAMAWDLYSFLMPIYGARIGLPASTIGIVMASFAVATLSVRLVMPMIIRRVRQWHVIVASLATSGASYLLFPLASGAPLLMVLSFALGFGLGCVQPVIMSLLYEAAPPGRQGEAVGVRTTIINASQTFIPLSTGALTVAVGMAPVFWVLAIVLLAAAWRARLKVK